MLKLILAIQPEHVLAVEHLPLIHRDPHRCAEDRVFNRLLVMLRLLTADRALPRYRDAVQWVPM